ncbi:hypothetical protein pdam_00015324 [Pocillopora damicornis]|uniref:Uncharacterized protein n=1 Tax=Pocillopora damicornis TaxID=46731 RepID=A0A3M6UL62_POCDA|nr:uncharacterized protein LOC113678460 [Pocillopora damicornis]XP_058970802.1 uncharacterized protein LOC131797190 [Pocillopora verrucosa]RMX54319.1 hypothetical protein pdam_00015324 [Pocillopora damicornis]
MTRKLTACAMGFVFISSIIVQNSAYLTIIERGLRACKSSANSNEDDSRVRRWGWWPPVITQRDCDIYRNILCNSKIFQGNLGKVPSNPTSSPSSQPPVGRLPRKRRSSSSIRKDFEAINMVENNWAVPQKDD